MIRVPGGIAILGSLSVPTIAYELEMVRGEYAPGVALTIADPPYGNILKKKWDRWKSDTDLVTHLLNIVRSCERLMMPGGAFYMWGGIGKPGFRPFYKLIPAIETETGFQMANHITWKKKRGYGVQHNYLFTREEIAYFVLGDIKEPRTFHVPYLDEKRGYDGYNKKYPAKSEFLRRTNVWTDITEILRGKEHEAQKPERLAEIMIETNTEPGDLVLDPFGGSGSTGLAARKLGRPFILIEDDPEQFEKMVARLRAGEEWDS